MASIAERPQGAAPQITSAPPTLTTDRPQPPVAPSPTMSTATHVPHEDYRGWASL